MTSRYKPVGWRNESYRHYLAAKGIKTRYDSNKYFAVMEKSCPYCGGTMVNYGMKYLYPDDTATKSFVCRDCGAKMILKKDSLGRYNSSKDDESLEEFSARTGFQKFNPLDPRTPLRRPAGFSKLSLEDKERFVKEEEAQVRAAEIFIKNLEEMHKRRPEFVRGHYGSLAPHFEVAERERREGSRASFLKAVGDVPPETKAPTEAQLVAEPVPVASYGPLVKELSRLEAEESLKADIAALGRKTI